LRRNRERRVEGGVSVRKRKATSNNEMFTVLRGFSVDLSPLGLSWG
jgi:hypothetical protein